MRDLGEEGRELIELGRAGDEPTGEDRARVRAALVARLGAAAGLGVAASLGVSASVWAKSAATASAGGGASASTTAATVAGGGALATKLIGAALLVAAGFGGGAATVHLHYTRRETVAAVVATPPAKSGAAGRQRAAWAVPEAAPSPDRDPVDETAARPPHIDHVDLGVGDTAAARSPSQPNRRAGAATHARISERRLSVLAIAAPETRPPEAAAYQPDREARAITPPPLPQGPSPSDAPAERRSRPDVAKETRLVGDGVAALRGGDAARALESFDAHAIAYPQGVLAVERAAERVLALAELDRPARACAELEAFLRAHSTSPLAARLRKRLRALDVRCDD